MTKETVEKLKVALKGEIYNDLVEWLTLQVRNMRDIDNVRQCSKAQDQALEFKAQLKAKDRLEGILNEIVWIKEDADKEKELEKVKDDIDDTGLPNK